MEWNRIVWRAWREGGVRLEVVFGIWKAETSEVGLSPTRTRVTATESEIRNSKQWIAHPKDRFKIKVKVGKDDPILQ